MSSTDVAEATYTGSCHCGAFVYTVKQSPPLTDPSCEVASCNCSICARNGYLHIYVHGDAVAFTKGEKSDFAVSQVSFRALKNPDPFPRTLTQSAFNLTIVA